MVTRSVWGRQIGSSTLPTPTIYFGECLLDIHLIYIVIACVVEGEMARKYTKELLESIVTTSTSTAQVLRKLGLKEAGGTHHYIKKKIDQYKIDISHFKGRGSDLSKGVKNKKEWSSLLIKRTDGKRRHAFKLRRALIESGREYKCFVCGQEGTWNGKKLMLQVEHKNKDWLDDRPENVEFICPNCHSQTNGWCGSKGFAEITSDSSSKRYRERKQKQKMGG